MPKLSLDAIEMLITIDQKGSFAAAAAQLYKVPSALTYSVQKLEEELDIQLFERQGRRSVLTAAGRLLVDEGQALIEAADRLTESAHQLAKGWEPKLTIAIDSILECDFIYPYLEQFLELKADIDIELQEQVMTGNWEALIEQRADLIIGAPAPILSTQGLIYKPMMDVEWVFAVSPQHVLSDAQTPVSGELIREHRAVVVRDTARQSPADSHRVFNKQNKLMVYSMAEKIAAQVAGLGVGYLPKHRIEEELSDGRLKELVLEEPVEPTPCFIAWRRGARGKALRWFVEQLTESSKIN